MECTPTCNKLLKFCNPVEVLVVRERDVFLRNFLFGVVGSFFGSLHTDWWSKFVFDTVLQCQRLGEKITEKRRWSILIIQKHLLVFSTRSSTNSLLVPPSLVYMVRDLYGDLFISLTSAGFASRNWAYTKEGRKSCGKEIYYAHIYSLYSPSLLCRICSSFYNVSKTITCQCMSGWLGWLHNWLLWPHIWSTQ